MLLKPLILRCKCDRCKQERKCAYIPELEEWMCSECLNVVCVILAECNIQGETK